MVLGGDGVGGSAGRKSVLCAATAAITTTTLTIRMPLTDFCPISDYEDTVSHR